MNSGETEYKLVRGLVRGLDLISALNRSGGRATINELSAEISVHRTTIRRLLETLQYEGYVERSKSDPAVFLLTRRVRELSEGFRDEQWISTLAAPLLSRLLEKVIWPTDLCTLDGDAMLVRETTHRSSRLSFHSQMVGRRLPMLLTASGRAYLAFCPEEERERILDILRTHEGPEGDIARQPEKVQSIIRQTQRQGYGANNSEWELERKIGAISIPVHASDYIIGCLTLVYIAKAMSNEEAAKRHLPDMQETVKRIESIWKLLPTA